jgi:hypothetical protein
MHARVSQEYMQACSQTKAGRHTTVGSQLIEGEQANASSNTTYAQADAQAYK